MIKVGVTGGIGSGKSTICKLLENLEYPVYYADDRAKFILANDQKCKEKIITEFGVKCYLENGELNRSYLADKVFNSEQEIKKLNAIVHPLVDEDFENWLIRNEKSNIVFKEAALLFETGGYKKLDKIIVVDAPLEVRIDRVLLRDPQRTKKQVEAIIAKQIPQYKKNELADYLIDNSAGGVMEQVFDVLEKLQ